mmetsp:Transcript_24538/g.68264  ORF Transcript_24538/g.68264 Transcript_24538/m.68264 type:complete len:281 (-) Transcript_24538:862-1704(-)
MSSIDTALGSALPCFCASPADAFSSEVLGRRPPRPQRMCFGERTSTDNKPLFRIACAEAGRLAGLRCKHHAANFHSLATTMASPSPSHASDVGVLSATAGVTGWFEDLSLHTDSGRPRVTVARLACDGGRASRSSRTPSPSRRITHVRCRENDAPRPCWSAICPALLLVCKAGVPAAAGQCCGVVPDLGEERLDIVASKVARACADSCSLRPAASAALQSTCASWSHLSMLAAIAARSEDMVVSSGQGSCRCNTTYAEHPKAKRSDATVYLQDASTSGAK